MIYKKIIIVGPAHPLRGGLSAFDERLAEELMKKGHEVVIYTFSLQYPNFLFPGKTQLSTEPSPTNLNIKVCINSINPFNWFSVGKRIRKESADLVVIRYWIPFMAPCLGTIARLVRRDKKSRLIALLDNIIPHEKFIGSDILTNYFVKPFQGFLAMSIEVKKDLNKFTQTKCIVSPHPVYDQYGEIISKDEACKKLSLDSGINYLLFFGFIRKYKGLDILLNSFSKTNAVKANTKLIIAGEFYEDEKYYLKLIEDLNLQNHVILKNDYIKDDMVRYYFCAADLIVQPYRTATQSGISQIAYHFEKPMLVTNVGGLPEIVEDNISGLVAEVVENSIAEKIDLFFKNNMSDSLAAGIKKGKEKFSWNYFAENLLDI